MDQLVVASGQVHSGLPHPHVDARDRKEQFYWTWPLALAVVLRGADGDWRSHDLVLIAVIVLHRLTGVSAVYFRTDTRADLLLLGCAIAIAASMSLFDRVPRAWNQRRRRGRASALAALPDRRANVTRDGDCCFTLVALAAGGVVVIVAVRPRGRPGSDPVHAALQWWACAPTESIFTIRCASRSWHHDRPRRSCDTAGVGSAHARSAAVSYRLPRNPFPASQKSLEVRPVAGGAVVGSDYRVSLSERSTAERDRRQMNT